MAGDKIDRVPRGLIRLFGDLKVRPKLIVLHNTFFLILACAVYFTLIPLFEDRVANARLRENSLLMQIFTDDRPLPRIPGVEMYDFREGSAESLGIPGEARRWLDENPGLVWKNPDSGRFLHRKTGPEAYRSARLPDEFYDDMIRQSQRTLFIVLGVIYVLAVMSLEFLIMPEYVYRPIRVIMRADRATRNDDRAGELIRPEEILDDEIGEIMKSRNATVSELRSHEDKLGETLEDLRSKNQMLETAKKKLEDQDRLASIGMLSASVAHEMNTPLSVLHGSIEKLMETTKDGQTRERLARMLRVTHRLRTIGESLVDFARTRKQVVEPVSIHRIIEEAWSLLAIDDKASGVSFRNLVAEDHLAMGNTDRLIQVFVNLLRNGLNAVPVGGRIQATSESVDDRGSKWVVIAVEDNGPGIAADVLPEIFDAFVTTRLDAKGTGLGLTVSEGIVRQHGGSITAANRPGGGARLEVRLPAAARVLRMSNG